MLISRLLRDLKMASALTVERKDNIVDYVFEIFNTDGNKNNKYQTVEAVTELYNGLYASVFPVPKAGSVEQLYYTGNLEEQEPEANRDEQKDDENEDEY